jgi:transcriptional regulator with XRE-family HTH domain
MVENENAETPYPEFGRIVTEALDALGESDAEIGKTLGVTREMVRRYRAGKAMPRDGKTMDKLAALIGVPPEKLRYPKAKGDARMSDPDEPPPMVLTAEERALIEAHRDLPPPAQKSLRLRAVELQEKFGKKSAKNPWGQS